MAREGDRQRQWNEGKAVGYGRMKARMVWYAAARGA